MDSATGNSSTTGALLNIMLGDYFPVKPPTTAALPCGSESRVPLASLDGTVSSKSSHTFPAASLQASGTGKKIKKIKISRVSLGREKGLEWERLAK